MLILLFSLMTHAAPVISETIGSVDDEFYTSRQARLSAVMDRLLQDQADAKTDVDHARAELLLEAALYKEANTMAVEMATHLGRTKLIEKTDAYIESHPDFRKDEFSAKEISDLANLKLVAKELLRLKSEVLGGEPSDAEAQDYFEKIGRSSERFLSSPLSRILKVSR